MPIYFVKPENALKRAEELISVGKEQDAVETLHDTIKARRLKAWTKTHEMIILKHLELCVNLRKPHLAKDALFQYKNLTQQVAIQSLETAISTFLQLAEQKTEEAQKSSIEKVEEIDDLDQADAPENLLLSSVSGAVTQDRMDRKVLAPWLRFLWDSYRNCLELLRNNSQVETLYHKIARQCFTFCCKYQRRTEFRKLCEHLRIHLNQIQKMQHLSHSVKLSNVESLTLMQDTRLIQLDSAIQMELWQEAYRSAEDVHEMMNLSMEKCKVKPATYANYCDKLALIFFQADNHLFHAAALLQKFIICKDMKRVFAVDEAQDQATRVLLATLSIPETADCPSDLSRHLDMDDVHFSNTRFLSSLLRLPMAPNRQSILKEIVRLNLPEIAIPNAANLYKLLESTNSPLHLNSRVDVQLTAILHLDKLEYGQYIGFLRTVAASKTLKQLAQLYETLSLNRVKSIVLPNFSYLEFERFLMNATKKRLIQATIDHRDHCVRFGSLTPEGNLEFSTDNPQVICKVFLIAVYPPNKRGHFPSRLKCIAPFGKTDMDGMRGHLTLLFTKLKSTFQMHDGTGNRRERLDKDDYERVLQRRKRIEIYKERSESQKQEKSRLKELEQNKKDEAKRLEQQLELEKRQFEFDKQRKLDEHEELKRRMALEELAKIKKSVIYRKIVEEHGEEALQSMDPQLVLQEQRRKLDSNRQEQQTKLKHQERKWDYMVRAMHLEQMKLQVGISATMQKEREEQWNLFEARRIQKAIDDRENAMSIYKNMQLVRNDAQKFLEQVKLNRKADFEAKMAEWKERLNAEKSRRLEKRHDLRRKERREEWITKMEADKQMSREMEERKVREEQQETLRRQRPAREEKSIRAEPPQDSKADTDSDWRASSAVHLQPPGGDRKAPEPDGGKVWQRVGPLGQRGEIDSVPRQQRIARPETADSKADSDLNWRTSRDQQQQQVRRGPEPEVQEKWSRKAAPPSDESEGAGSRNKVPAWRRKGADGHKPPLPTNTRKF